MGFAAQATALSLLVKLSCRLRQRGKWPSGSAAVAHAASLAHGGSTLHFRAGIVLSTSMYAHTSACLATYRLYFKRHELKPRLYCTCQGQLPLSSHSSKLNAFEAACHHVTTAGSTLAVRLQCRAKLFCSATHYVIQCPLCSIPNMEHSHRQPPVEPCLLPRPLALILAPQRALAMVLFPLRLLAHDMRSQLAPVLGILVASLHCSPAILMLVRLYSPALGRLASVPEASCRVQVALAQWPLAQLCLRRWAGSFMLSDLARQLSITGIVLRIHGVATAWLVGLIFIAAATSFPFLSSW